MSKKIPFRKDFIIRVLKADDRREYIEVDTIEEVNEIVKSKWDIAKEISIYNLNTYKVTHAMKNKGGIINDNI